MKRGKYEQLVRDQTDFQARVRDANLDIEELLARQGLHLEYDREADYLYLVIGKPRPGMAVPFDSVATMVDPESYQLLGVEIPFFLELAKSGKLSACEADLFRLLTRWLQEADDRFSVPPGKELRDAAASLERVLLG